MSQQGPIKPEELHGHQMHLTLTLQATQPVKLACRCPRKWSVCTCILHAAHRFRHITAYMALSEGIFECQLIPVMHGLADRGRTGQGRRKQKGTLITYQVLSADLYELTVVTLAITLMSDTACTLESLMPTAHHERTHGIWLCIPTHTYFRSLQACQYAQSSIRPLLLSCK